MLGMREYTHSIKQVGKKCEKKVCARREVLIPPPLCTNRAKYNTSLCLKSLAHLQIDLYIKIGLGDKKNWNKTDVVLFWNEEII